MTPFLTIAEAAQLLKVCEETLRKHLHEYDGVVRVGRGYRIDQEKFLASAEVKRHTIHLPTGLTRQDRQAIHRHCLGRG